MDRIISEDWSDDEYICELADDEYRIYDLLIKNTNRIGISKQPKSLLCWRANKMEGKRFDEIIAKLTADHKIAIVNGYTAILNHHKHWDYSKPNSAKGAVYDLRDVIDEVKDSPAALKAIGNIINKLLKQSENNKNCSEVHTMVIEYLYNTYSIPIEYPLYSLKEKEKEKEKEKKKVEREKDITPPTPSSAPQDTPKTAREADIIYHQKIGDEDVSTCNEWEIWIPTQSIIQLQSKYGTDAVLKAQKAVNRKCNQNGGAIENPEAYLAAVAKSEWEKGQGITQKYTGGKRGK